ncbi:unnamed protein product [Caenorhabditis sp. 36 PRJEB53466]|nr:unnamed protein product [Caenorhabditis sp. 36 PRJEB53466]
MKVLHSALSLCILLTVAVSVADSETSTDVPTTTPKSFLDNVRLFLKLDIWINAIKCPNELIKNVLKNDTALHFVFYISADDEAQFNTIFHDFIAKFPTFGFFRNCSLVSGLSSMSKCMNKQIKAYLESLQKSSSALHTRASEEKERVNNFLNGELLTQEMNKFRECLNSVS